MSVAPSPSTDELIAGFQALHKFCRWRTKKTNLLSPPQSPDSAAGARKRKSFPQFSSSNLEITSQTIECSPILNSVRPRYQTIRAAGLAFLAWHFIVTEWCSRITSLLLFS